MPFQVTVHTETYVGEDDVITPTLAYNDDSGIQMKLTPEGPICATGDAQRGSIWGDTSNGDFRMDWTLERVTLRVGKYGDGCGGTLEVTLAPDDSFAAAAAALARFA